MPIPLLLLSDSPTSGTGLGRITRDLAIRIAEHLPDVFRVGTLGYGGLQSRSLPFPQYPWQSNPQWIVHELQDVWADFAGSEQGIVMTIWDASRLLWFSRPETLNTDPALKAFLTNPPFKRWGYWPIDATGPNNKLTAILAHTIAGYDRNLAYSRWAEEILERTLPSNEFDNVPHGIDTSVFNPRHRGTARHGFGQRLGIKNQKSGKFVAIPDDVSLIGIVATNQVRKDYGLSIQAVMELKKTRKVVLWIHTDTLERHWSIPALLNDYGAQWNENIVTCVPFSDDQMAWSYAACDLTMGIGNGEGFGFPIFESIACGTPCLHGNYGGAPEHMPREMLVSQVGASRKQVRLEGPYNCLRGVYDPLDWAAAAENILAKKMRTTLPPQLDWNGELLWPRWEAWLRKGVA